MNEPIIITNPARCRDCYLCVRNCVVKAIQIKEQQASIIPELCILCGTCVHKCPQQAKSVRQDRPMVEEMMRQGCKVVASVAPSAPAFFDMNTFSDLEETLKELGFHAAEETAVGAEIVGCAHREYVEKAQDSWPVITSACPVVVNLIEKYYPDLIPHLAPIVSPMIAHGRLLAKKYGDDACIVFIGPCIAKKEEMSVEAVAGSIQAVITFPGVQEWFEEKGIQCRKGVGGDEKPATQMARLFPVEGGLVGTAEMSTDVLDSHTIVETGLDACRDIFEDIRAKRLNASLVELMACEGGCVNGPSITNMQGGGTYLARQKVIEFHMRNNKNLFTPRQDWPSLERTYMDRMIRVPDFTEKQIQEVLHRVNKYTPEDELNCGACGYSSCREKAIATLRGMAEETMCIPFMRSRSESLRQVVMDVTYNSIIIFDTDFIIHDMSPAAEKLFSCTLADVQGKHLSCLISSLDDFYSVRYTGKPVIAKTRTLRQDNEIIAEQTIVRLEQQSLMVAIIRDITEQVKEREKNHALRKETLDHTREMVSRQMRVAHKIAHLLGETTAESKTIFSNLAKILEEDEHL